MLLSLAMQKNAIDMKEEDYCRLLAPCTASAFLMMLSSLVSPHKCGSNMFESAIPRVATCFEDEETIHFDLSHFLCLARTDKQMVGRTSFNHVQTPLTFDNVSRILFSPPAR